MSRIATDAEIRPFASRGAASWNTVDAVIASTSGTLDGENLADEGLDARNLGNGVLTVFDRNASGAIEMAVEMDTEATLNNGAYAILVLGVNAELDWTAAPLTVGATDRLSIEGHVAFETKDDGTVLGCPVGETVFAKVYYDAGAGYVALDGSECQHMNDVSFGGTQRYNSDDITLSPGGLISALTIRRVAIYVHISTNLVNYRVCSAYLQAVLHRQAGP